MFKRDYIMRLIEQISEVAGVLLGMKRQQKPHEALAIIDETLKRLFGLNSNLINGLSERDLIALLGNGGGAVYDKLPAVAVLLKEEGDFWLELGRPDEAYHRHLKALKLHLAAAEQEVNPAYLHYFEEIDELTARLKPFEFPSDTKSRLWRYYEQTGRFADAEDVWYELLEADGGGNGGRAHLEEGLRFYERLLEHDDKTLTAGRLPRSEILEAMEDLKSRLDNRST